MSLPAGRRIGPHGEIYVNEGTRHQTFSQAGEVRVKDWPEEGAPMIAKLLRSMAHTIEQHAKVGQFISDAGMPFPGNPYVAPSIITTPLCALTMWGTIEEPPRHGRFGEDYIMDSYRVTVRARLGFE